MLNFLEYLCNSLPQGRQCLNLGDGQLVVGDSSLDFGELCEPHRNRAEALPTHLDRHEIDWRRPIFPDCEPFHSVGTQEWPRRAARKRGSEVVRVKEIEVSGNAAWVAYEPECNPLSVAREKCRAVLVPSEVRIGRITRVWWNRGANVGLNQATRQNGKIQQGKESHLEAPFGR